MKKVVVYPARDVTRPMAWLEQGRRGGAAHALKCTTPSSAQQSLHFSHLTSHFTLPGHIKIHLK